MFRRTHRIALGAVLLIGLATRPPLAGAATDVHFDYTSFDNPNSPGADPHFGQNQFNVLNYPSINGNYMMTSTDDHRPEMLANNNQFAEFYNWLQQRYDAHTTKDGNVSADEIHAYVQSNSPTLSAPKWLILNEMSTSLWPNNATYRAWLIQTATKLKDTYGYNVVTYTTFAGAPGQGADFRALAAKSYIAVENYLSGAEIMNHGTDYASRVTWAQAQYEWSQTVYGNLGIDSSRLFMSEHFGNTTSAAGWGRGGISASDWDTVIQIRQDAIYNANYVGFLAYGWGSNGMGVTEAEQLQHEYYYRSRLVLPTQQPQWLSNTAINLNGTIPLSWGQALNWIGGVPDGAGKVANFFRTNTAARTITLDGSRTVGTLTFNSAQPFTIAPGTGGTLTLDNGASAVVMSVAQGSHTVSANVALTGTANVSVSSGATLLLSGNVSGAGAITKSGTGTLSLTGTNSYAGGTSISAGTLKIKRLHESSAVSITGGTLQVTAISPTLPSHPAGSDTSVSRPSSLAIANNGAPLGLRMYSGTLDLTNNDLIIDYTAGGANPAKDIEDMVRAGYNGGTWQGIGLTSSIAAAGGGEYVLAVADNALLASPFGNGTGGKPKFDGQSVDDTTVLVKFTHRVDLNLDGLITDADAILFSTNYETGAYAYQGIGDLNYDGVFSDDDAIIFSTFYDTSLQHLPEPAAAGMLALAGLGQAVRRRRRWRDV
jgi:autotransporter-associated beta strand protein